MPRRGSIAKRDVLPDPLYNSKLVTRLINNIMYDGKKGVAQKIVYGAFDIIAEKTLSVDYDKNRLEQELIYYIEKLDVNEEKQRLSNHLKYFISTMESGNGQGKKLGFIAAVCPDLLSKSVKTLIRWLKLTRLSLITDGNFIISVY